MGEILKLEWEYVSPISHPDCYEGDSPSVHVSIVPDEYWTKVTKYAFDKGTRTSLIRQFNGLLDLMEKDELIRNTVLCKTKATPEWEEMARANGNNHSPT